MKKQVSKKLFAFIVMAMVFSVLPKYINAQRNCKPGYILVCDANGKHCNCVKFSPCGGRNCGGFALTSTTGFHLSSISFQLEEPGKVSIKIYDITGKLIKTLIDNKMPLGGHEIQWNNRDENGNAVSTGVYLLKLDLDNHSETRKLLIKL